MHRSYTGVARLISVVLELENKLRIISLQRTSDDSLLIFGSVQNPQPTFLL